MFVVNAYRFGDRELHSYTVGLYNTEARAFKAAEDETQYRSGKYQCEIISLRVNENCHEFYNMVQKLPK